MVLYHFSVAQKRHSANPHAGHCGAGCDGCHLLLCGDRGIESCIHQHGHDAFAAGICNLHAAGFSLPFGIISDFGYATIIVTVIVFYVLASLELIAEEIEDPFGTDTNDLPTDDIAKTIQANLKEIL